MGRGTMEESGKAITGEGDNPWVELAFQETDKGQEEKEAEQAVTFDLKEAVYN